MDGETERQRCSSTKQGPTSDNIEVSGTSANNFNKSQWQSHKPVHMESWLPDNPGDQTVRPHWKGYSVNAPSDSFLPSCVWNKWLPEPSLKLMDAAFPILCAPSHPHPLSPLYLSSPIHCFALHQHYEFLIHTLHSFISSASFSSSFPLSALHSPSHPIFLLP